MEDTAVLDAFLAAKSPATARIYRITLIQWHAACPDGFAAATTEQVMRWWGTKQQQSKATRRRTLQTLRSFYQFGQKVARWPRNPWFQVAKPVVRITPPRHVLSQEQISQLFTAAHDDTRGHAVLMLLLSTGLRVGELAAARWQDLRMSDDKQYVLVVPSPQQGRLVKLLPAVWAATTRYRTTLGLPSELNAEDSSPLIWGRSGRPVQPNTITALVAKLAQKAGLPVLPPLKSTSGKARPPRVTASWLRAAHAVWAHHAGATSEQIQMALGLKTREAVDKYLRTSAPVGKTSADVLPKVFRELQPRDSSPAEE